MKNCQVNKKVNAPVICIVTDKDIPQARTGLDDLVSGVEDSLLDVANTTTATVPVGNNSPQSNKKTGRSRKSEKKKREDIGQQIEFPSQNSDMGYISGESQCTPVVVMMKGSNRTQLSGYNSSGYDTEYPSLNEEHGVPPLIHVFSDQSDQFYGHEEIIKTEQFSPSSQLGDHMTAYQLSQPPPPPYVNGHHYKVHGLQPLPEIQYRHSGYYQSPGVIENHSSGYSSFGGSPLITGSDEIGVSFSLSSGHRSIKGGSDLTSSSHSSFSTISSRLSTPSSSHEYSKVPTHSYRNLRPPDLILRPPHQPYVQISDIKSHQPYYRHSDEISLRSSHSSRYSGSEFSDDLRTMVPPPLPPADIRSSPREPLPLPQSMQQQTTANYMMTQADVSDPQNQYIQTVANQMNYAPNSYTAAGSVPLQHYEPKSHHQILPMIYEANRAESPNMVIGNMSLNANQLHQETLLFESLSNSNVLTAGGIPH